MQNRILDVVADKLIRDASGDPSALTPAQRAEREGMSDPERFDEFTGPMDGEQLRYYALVEQTHGPHHGKVWRSEYKLPSEVARINASIAVIKWEERQSPEDHRRCDECDAYPATTGSLCEGCAAYRDHTQVY